MRRDRVRRERVVGERGEGGTLAAPNSQSLGQSDSQTVRQSINHTYFLQTSTRTEHGVCANVAIGAIGNKCVRTGECERVSERSNAT